MSADNVKETIRIVALKNAVEHGGNAQADAVIGKFISSRPDLRSQIKSIIQDIKSIVQEVNAMNPSEQKSMLEKMAPEELREKAPIAQKEFSLPPLEGAEMGKVVTRFPPEPNGYPHIGHAKAAIIDEEYARMYGGKLILRFDDTNPLKEKLEYYHAIAEGLEWLGVKPDIVKNTSDDISLLHNYGKKLVESGGAYVCTCSQDKIHNLRSQGLPCECRKEHSVALERIGKLFDGSYEQNGAIIRFMGDMADQNTAMRDPALFRIIEGDHPKLGSKIRVWPTYDFAAPVEDSLDGVTHAMRTKEYELRNPLYFAILERLGLRKPQMIEFSRLEFDGVPVSKRKIKPLIESGVIERWDDPRLPTLAAFRRRGFLPEAIRKFVLSLGITLAETKPPFETLEAFNRKIIDPTCVRLFFVKNPVEVRISGAQPKKVVLKNHPVANLGIREVNVTDSVYIAGDDTSSLKIGDTIRLIELYNVKIDDVSSDASVKTISVSYDGEKIVQEMPKIQWIAKNDIVPYRVMIPDKLYIGEEYNTNSMKIAEGFAESSVSTLSPDARVQFVRFGFCRIDGNNSAILSHR